MFVTHPPAQMVFSWGFPQTPAKGAQPPFETPDCVGPIASLDRRYMECES